MVINLDLVHHSLVLVALKFYALLRVHTAHLVEIFNRNELDFIRQEAKNIGNHVAWDYWIGLRKEAQWSQGIKK